MIFAPRIVYGLVALVAVAAVAAVAHPAKETLEQTKSGLREPVREAELQQRRARLRASLKTRSEVAMAREAPADPSPRLLSDQERADLRQQLRQQ